MSPAHRGYLRYSHHLNNDRTPTTPFPPEDAPDLSKGARSGRLPLHQRRPTPRGAPEDASGSRGVPACSGHRRPPRRRRIRVRHRRIRGLHHRHPNAVAIPAAITHNTTRRNSPRPPPSPVPAAVVNPAADAFPAASPSRQIRPERHGSGGHRLRHSRRLPRPPEREETRSSPPPPSLRPRGFVGGHSGDGEVEKGGGGGGRGAAGSSPPEPPLGRVTREGKSL
uniref:Transcription factor EIL1-like n=1 Tax=Oryza sativa subsp. japonica TaxID=39947 RepID=Q6EQX4_ORYSJ|nr:transcription factor EIL1-like [Oryza sativa Japonica Group]